MRVIISAGGTGGHIFPAIAVADELKKQDPSVEILFVGALGKMEMERVPKAGYKIEGLPIAGLQRRLTIKNIILNLQLPFKLLKSMLKVRRILKDFKPDVAVGFGGFASGLLRLKLSDDPLKKWLEQQGLVSFNDNNQDNGNGPQSISID